MISCKCITYGRVELLEEALESFLRQEYEGEKELIIVNDYPLQKLHYEHPEVRIFNLDKTFDTIGEKENFALSKCSGEIIAVWDDDDIALKNHLSNIDKYFGDADLMFWANGVYFGNKKIQSLTSLGNSGIVYSKSIWEKIGGHPLENAGYDQTFVESILKNSKKIAKADPPDDEASWFYMWADRSYHMSGLGTDDGTRPNAIQRHSAHVESLRKQGKIPVGKINLKPKWKQNYEQMLKDYVRKQNKR